MTRPDALKRVTGYIISNPSQISNRLGSVGVEVGEGGKEGKRKGDALCTYLPMLCLFRADALFRAGGADERTCKAA